MLAMQLFQQILGLFCIMASGFGVVRLKLLRPEDSRILSLVSIYIIIPCVNINAFQIDYTPSVMRGFLLALVLAVVLHGVLLAINSLLKRFGMSPVERLSVIYSNCGNLVIPLVAALFGSEWVIYASAFMGVQILFLWTHAKSVMSGQSQFDWRKILTNVNLITVVVGFILFLCHIRLPEVVGGVVASVASMIGPISMIMIGMMIGGAPLGKIFRNKRVYLISLLRLVAIPLVGIALLKPLGGLIRVEHAETILTIVLLAIITPVSTTTTQLAQFYNNDAEYSSAINVMTTLLCALTMPLMIALFRL